MEVTTNSFITEAAELRARRRLSDVLSPIPAMLLGKMPTAEEYEQLMNSLIIEDVQLFEEDDEQTFDGGTLDIVETGMKNYSDALGRYILEGG